MLKKVVQKTRCVPLSRPSLQFIDESANCHHQQDFSLSINEANACSGDEAITGGIWEFDFNNLPRHIAAEKLPEELAKLAVLRIDCQGLNKTI